MKNAVLQYAAALELASDIIRLYFQTPAWNLDDSSISSRAASQYNPDTHHPLIADQADLNRMSLFQVGCQRNDGIQREVTMRDERAILGQNIIITDTDKLHIRKQAPGFLRRQIVENVI